MRTHLRVLAAAAPLAALAAASADGAVINVGADPADYEAHRQVGTGTVAVSNGASGYLRIGTRTTGASGTVASAIFPFALPTIPAGETIDTVFLSVQTEPQTGNLPVSNVDLYALPIDPGPAVDTNAANEFSGANDATAGVVKLQDNFLEPSDVTATGTRYQSIDISSYIAGLYANGANPGDFVTLRLSYDAPVDTTAHNRYQIRSRQATSTTENPPEEWPLLIVTTVPEPGAAGVLAAAGAGLLARRRRAR